MKWDWNKLSCFVEWNARDWNKSSSFVEWYGIELWANIVVLSEMGLGVNRVVLSEIAMGQIVVKSEVEFLEMKLGKMVLNPNPANKLTTFLILYLSWYTGRGGIV